MLKKRLGLEGIERGRCWLGYEYIFKVPSILTIPEGCEIIGGYTFDGYESLREVVIPEGVKEISTQSFASCKNLRKVIIPESLESIGRYAFAGCVKLEKIDVPGSVKELGEGAFYCCKSADIILRKPLKEFKSIGSHTFGFSKGVKLC